MKPIISFDLACTLFWEHGCDPRYPDRPVRYVFLKLIDYIRKLGYRVPGNIHGWRYYYELWRDTWRRGPVRELWHRYILLKYLYKLGIRVNHEDLDKIYTFFIRERAKSFILPRRNRLLLEYLRGRGYQLILTTGTGAHDLPLEIIRRNNASHYFSMVFSTQLIGIPKSEYRFYEEIIDVLGVDPGYVIHIGDSLSHDILPARRAGLKTIYYGWRNWCRASDPQPCVIDLWDILDYLL